jgi:hypothetical protein
MENNIYESRRLERYKNRIIELVDNSIKKTFWTEEKNIFFEKLTDISNTNLISPEKIARKMTSKQ